MKTPARPHLVEAIGQPCPYCGQAMDLPDRPPTDDHAFKPRSKGGTLSHFNRLVVCLPCNNDKADLSIWDWRRSLKASGDPRAKYVAAAAFRAQAEAVVRRAVRAERSANCGIPALGSAQG